ncbi:MAG: glycosyltransferase family 2 protein [candidate division WOR-3 bacterium]|nr:MAG: glycosyltransferase family 2 protein [candidate division WOR-3 bacterium]
MDLRNIGAVIPAYNAEKTIVSVIDDLVDYGFRRDNVIVVNDGSSDRTGEIVNRQGVILLNHEKNLGKGAALRNGFENARKRNIKKVVVVDADAQHRVSEIDAFMELNGRHDVIIGARKDITKSMPLDRLLTNRTVNLVVSLLSGVRTTDVQCGFRYVDLKIFDEIELKTNRYQIESEMVIKAARKKFKIGFVPVSTIYGSEKSHINPLVDTVRFINMAVRFLWH